MHIASYKKTKTAPSDRLDKNGTQQKKHPLMPFKNNGTLQKWYMTNAPPKIDKYDTHRKRCLTKMTHLAKKCPKITCQELSRVIFKDNS